MQSIKEDFPGHLNEKKKKNRTGKNCNVSAPETLYF